MTRQWSQTGEQNHSGIWLVSTCRGNALKEVTAKPQRAHLGIGNRALEHPEAAVGVDVTHAPCSDHLLCTLNCTRHLICTLYISGLDVNHTQAQTDLGLEVLEGLQFLSRPVCAFLEP